MPEVIDKPKGTTSWDREVLEQIWNERMLLCYKALLFVTMCDLSSKEGTASLRDVAESFSKFFSARLADGKAGENPNCFPSGRPPSGRSISEWEREIRSEPLARIKNALLVEDGNLIRWNPELWTRWSSGFRRALRNTAETRLIEYFDTYVPGGF